MGGNTSDELIEYIIGQQSKEEIKETEALYTELIEDVEGICTGTAFRLHDFAKSPDIKLRGLLESVFDTSFCYNLVKRVPGMVSRALRLEPLVVSDPPQRHVNLYLREATRAYLLGLFMASVALSRSALEQALEEKVPKGLQTDSKEEKLKKLIKAAELSKLLKGDLLCLADGARKSANKVVHGETCSESKAFDILIKTREVVRSLYSRSNNPNAPHRRSQE